MAPLLWPNCWPCLKTWSANMFKAYLKSKILTLFFWALFLTTFCCGGEASPSPMKLALSDLKNFKDSFVKLSKIIGDIVCTQNAKNTI